VTPQPGAVQPRRPYQPFADITWASNPLDSISHQLQLGAKKRTRRGSASRSNTSSRGHWEWRRRRIRLTAVQPGEHQLRPAARRGGQLHLGAAFRPGKRWVSEPGASRAMVGAGSLRASRTSTRARRSPWASPTACKDARWASRHYRGPHAGQAHERAVVQPGGVSRAHGCRYGTSARMFLFGPNNFNWDAAVMKTNPVFERAELQFRAEFFNILNHPQWGNPRTNISAPSPGMITSASGERQIQFALRLRW